MKLMVSRADSQVANDRTTAAGLLLNCGNCFSAPVIEQCTRKERERVITCVEYKRSRRKASSPSMCDRMSDDRPVHFLHQFHVPGFLCDRE